MYREDSEMLVYFDGLNELYILKGNYLVAGRAINNSEIGHGYGWLHRSKIDISSGLTAGHHILNFPPDHSILLTAAYTACSQDFPSVDFSIIRFTTTCAAILVDDHDGMKMLVDDFGSCARMSDALSLEPTTAPLAFFHSELLDIDTSHADTDMLGTELAKLELLDLAGASDTQINAYAMQHVRY
ncbi:hypothetical protein EG327_003474 [Venturia inaequalis]|uniref:Uncharacterized protein n=1 Tax=Venturia inaequalis TaxID=5025 RepID=A0A8H3ZCC3_VENIN|nr:hypothetical protein EG327_003474 [Venturia inaequalis]